jgi:hypothetical protein
MKMPASRQAQDVAIAAWMSLRFCSSRVTRSPFALRPARLGAALGFASFVVFGCSGESKEPEDTTPVGVTATNSTTDVLSPPPATTGSATATSQTTVTTSSPVTATTAPNTTQSAPPVTAASSSTPLPPTAPTDMTEPMLPPTLTPPVGTDTASTEPSGTGGNVGVEPQPSATEAAGGESGSMGGSPGAGGEGTVPPGPSGGLGCTGSELLCDDFESTAAGMVPTGAWHALDDSCQYQMTQFSMGVSTEQKKSGSQSLKITNKHFAQCRLSGTFEPPNDFWIRTYEYWAADLDLSNRETLAVDMTPGYRTADDPALRFGNRSKAPCEDFAGPQITIIGLTGGEATGCGSRVLPQGEWYCFEAHIQQTDRLIVNTYINGDAISYQSVGKEETESISTDTAITDKIDTLRLGIFSTGEATGDVYIDDVAVSTTRIGCAP